MSSGSGGDARTATTHEVGEPTSWRRDDPVGYWASEEFRAEAEAWAGAALAELGRGLRGPLRPHRLRFWSGVFSAASDRGVVWFKATNPGQAFEAALLRVLARIAPDDVLAPLAVDAERGWMLLPDGGPTLRQRGPTTQDWERLVVQAARMQQSLVASEAELAAAGLPRLLPDDAPGHVRRMVTGLRALPPENPQHVDAATADALLAGVGRLADDVSLLASTGVAATLQPNDLGVGNAFAPRRADGRARLFDFGDAFWSHPFAVLQVPLRMATGAWPDPPGPAHPVAERLRTAYLDAWSLDLAPMDAVRVMEAADHLASVHRCESWRRLLAFVEPAAVPAPVPRLAWWLADAVRVPGDRSQGRSA